MKIVFIYDYEDRVHAVKLAGHRQMGICYNSFIYSFFAFDFQMMIDSI